MKKLYIVAASFLCVASGAVNSTCLKRINDQPMEKLKELNYKVANLKEETNRKFEEMKEETKKEFKEMREEMSKLTALLKIALAEKLLDEKKEGE
ncbi:MAG: hypothetical protein LBP31_00415 [Holosporales bacterium]|jgi:F0F1-type ATP synthase membrane subunit b/b'|nr:hypothetical protein [Holosporales bacterium]